MKWTKAAVLVVLVTASAVTAEEQKPNASNDRKDCPMMGDGHAAGVDGRGDKGMGFSHEKTTHHFRILPDGGAIEVTANDAKDETSRNQIRMHLGHISKMFAAGNFDIPMFVHDQMPDGAEMMREMKSDIGYQYEEMKSGGRVRITTSNPKALAAIHQFLRFQIKEHRTGDPMEAAL